jgi:hypothetical protein
MLFTVNPELKHNLIISTINHPIRPGALLSIEGDDLGASDVVTAIDNGYIVPKNKKEYEASKVIFESSKLMITNKTNKLLIIGQTSMRAGAVIVVKQSEVNMDRLILASNSGQIDIQNVAGEDQIEETVTVGDVPSEKKIKAETEEDISEDTVEEEHSSKVWDFRKQNLVEAEKVPTSSEPKKMISEDEDSQEKKTVVKKAKKAKKVKKTKKSKKAKKVNRGKIKKVKKTKVVKKIQPVGEEKVAATSADAILDLDARGKPVNKVSDQLQSIIDETINNDISFVDTEQTDKTLENREDINA